MVATAARAKANRMLQAKTAMTDSSINLNTEQREKLESSIPVPKRIKSPTFTAEEAGRLSAGGNKKPAIADGVNVQSGD